MNTSFKRVEVKIKDIDETVLLVNFQSYSFPDIEVGYMHLTYLGEIVWHDTPDYKRLDNELNLDYNNYFDVIEKNKNLLYDNPNKELVIDGVEVETIGVRNDYRYNSN